MDELVLVYDERIININGFHHIFKENEPLDLTGNQTIYSIVITYKDKSIDADYLEYNDSNRRDIDFVKIISAINKSQRFLNIHKYD